ncbi:SAGA HAT/Core module component, variant 2 [Orbilia ellipsospora]|uniref:SAGA HAT/Core module component, variant 2 n=1 Tax=Orbilia ellipsospora TaxID=2528407 RepID=A0AAV9WV39_9PEZI
MSQRGNRLMHQSEQQEERSLWQKVVNELKALMAHEAKVNDIRRKIDTLEERNRRPEDLQELMTCYKGLKALTEEESRMLSHVIEHNLSILIGLRKATEQGYGSSGTGRDGLPKRKRNEATSVDGSAGRNKPRSMSVPNENGPILQVGSQVAFRLPKQKGAEGEWIQCDVINILGEGNKRRYGKLILTFCFLLGNVLNLYRCLLDTKFRTQSQMNSGTMGRFIKLLPTS